jgi:hypothetical protein
VFGHAFLVTRVGVGGIPLGLKTVCWGEMALRLYWQGHLGPGHGFATLNDISSLTFYFRSLEELNSKANIAS